MNEEKAFDAGESYLREADREPSARGTVSLVAGIFRLIGQRPGPAVAAGRRETFIKAAATELTARGVDAVALIRYGMSQELIAPLISALLVKLIIGEDFAIENGVDAPAWCAALGIDPSVSPVSEASVLEIAARFNEVIIPAVSRIRTWVGSASLDQLMSLTPPKPGELATADEFLPGERALCEQYRWIVDHLAQTFYTEWVTSSLHSELRLLDGACVPPCAVELMNDRPVSRQELVEEIARRAVYRTGIPSVDDPVAAEMTRHAISLLRQGRCRDAAAVFEFGETQRPEDPEIRNNLGFCMIPLDAAAALERLKKAANMGYRSVVTNLYNQMCCYWALGRSRAALNIAAAAWPTISSEPESAVIWKLTSQGEWELCDDGDPALAIAAFAAEIAHREGWQEQARLWQANKESYADRLSGAA